MLSVGCDDAVLLGQTSFHSRWDCLLHKSRVTCVLMRGATCIYCELSQTNTNHLSIIQVAETSNLPLLVQVVRRDFNAAEVGHIAVKAHQLRLGGLNFHRRHLVQQMALEIL